MYNPDIEEQKSAEELANPEQVLTPAGVGKTTEQADAEFADEDEKLEAINASGDANEAESEAING